MSSTNMSWPGPSPKRPMSGGILPAAPDVLNAERPEATATPTRERVVIDGSDIVRGRSRVLVKAPIAAVRAAVLDFDHYAEFMPHYRTSRVLGLSDDGGRQVYMQVAALHGALKMGARIKMPPPTTADGVETHESQFISGNVNDFKAIWRLEELDEKRTALTLEVLLDPTLPLPVSLVNDENIDGAVKGVAAMRDRIEAAQPK